MGENKGTLLRYDGGADLVFDDKDGNRHRVARGQQFVTDEKTANALLESDPAIVEVNPGKRSRSSDEEEIKPEALIAAAPPVTAPPPTLAEQLVGEAAPHRSSSEAEPAEPPPADTGVMTAEAVGTDAVGKTPGGGETADVGTTTAPVGVVTLGDIPEGGKKSGNRGSRGS